MATGAKSVFVLYSKIWCLSLQASAPLSSAVIFSSAFGSSVLDFIISRLCSVGVGEPGGVCLSVCFAAVASVSLAFFCCSSQIL